MDIDDSDGQVGEVLFRTPLDYATPDFDPVMLRIADWDFNPGDGLLHSLEMEGDLIRRLVSVDPTTGAVQLGLDLSDKLPDGHNYGAVYVEDFSGTIYVSNNDVEDRLDQGMPDPYSQTFGIYADGTVIPYTPAAAAPAHLINDGADCLVATDFGDAPDTFGTLEPNGGPGHILSEVGDPDTYDFDEMRKLRIGAEIDPDLDGMPTVKADGDDLNLKINDEDGVPAGALLPGPTRTLTVPVVNTTGETATLAGWIDLDGSGTFDTGERALASVPAAGGDAILTWTAPATIASSYLRLRLYPGDVADPLPTTNPTFTHGGEVEDHMIGLGELPITGSRLGSLVKTGGLLIVCGGLGYLLGTPRRRPLPRAASPAGANA